MSDTRDVQVAADGYLAQLGEYRFSQAAPVMSDALSIGRLQPALLATMSQAPAALYQRLAAGLTGMADPFAAGVLAIQLGTLVEHGQHPAMLGEAMAARLPGDLAAARRSFCDSPTETATPPRRTPLPPLCRRRRASSRWVPQRGPH